MNNEQARNLILHMRLAAQKARANISETLAGKDMSIQDNQAALYVARLLDYKGGLFGEDRNLLETLLHYEAKETLEPGDVYNALHLFGANQVSTLTYQIMYGDLPQAMKTMVDMMNEQYDRIGGFQGGKTDMGFQASLNDRLSEKGDF